MTGRPTRRQVLVLAGAGVAGLAGCTGDEGDDSDPDADSGGDDSAGSGGNGDGSPGSTNDPTTTDEGSTATETASDDQGSADPSEHSPPVEERAVPLQHSLADFEEYAVDGGPPKDGIPSIDDPTFEGPSTGDEMLDPGDPVFGVEIDGEARAYSQHILVLHEIVNDTIAGHNLAVTYCPLTGTAIGFERGRTEFGVTGRLVNNNLIMYDRGTDSWWPQILGAGVKGDLKGKSLRERRVVWTTWERWRDEHPETRVLTEDTGYARNYNRDPYGSYNPPGGYYDNNRYLFGNLHTDDRFDGKTVFMGARSADGAIAFEKDLLRDQQLLDGTVGEVPHLAAYDEALDTAYVYRNPDGKSVEPTDDGFSGPDGTYAADELPLQQVNTFDAMWFAWVAFYPETAVVA